MSHQATQHFVFSCSHTGTRQSPNYHKADTHIIREDPVRIMRFTQRLFHRSSCSSVTPWALLGEFLFKTSRCILGMTNDSIIPWISFNSSSYELIEVVLLFDFAPDGNLFVRVDHNIMVVYTVTHLMGPYKVGT